MLASLMHLEITDSVSRVVTMTACKPLLYVMRLKVSAQMTQLHGLITAPAKHHAAYVPLTLYTNKLSDHTITSIARQYVPTGLLVSPLQKYWQNSSFVDMASSAHDQRIYQLLVLQCSHLIATDLLFVDSRPSDHYFRSVCWFVCLFVCAEFFSAVFDPISIKLAHMFYVWSSCVH